MRAKQVVVELVPSRIDVVLFVGGRRVDAVRVPANLPHEPRDWAAAIGLATEAVRAAVTKLDADGCPAVILYQSPTQAVDFSSFPVRGAEAIQAAELECTDALPYTADLARLQCVLLGRDREGDPKQHHVLATAERGDMCTAIVGFVEACGLKFDHAVPLNAMTLAGLVTTMLGSSGGPVRGHLHIGEQAAFFLVAEGGTLLFARQIRIGLESIVTSLTRPIHRGAGAPPTQLEPTAARRILFEHGRPARDAVVDEAMNLKGHELAPLMQPVLQRLVIELRQSLRFGMSAEQREKLVIAAGGPGATVPGFAELLSTELGVEVTTDDSMSRYRWNEPAGPGSEVLAAARNRALHSKLNLQPLTLCVQRNTDRLRRWLWTGAAASLIVVGLDAARFQLQLGDLREKADALTLQASSQDALRVTNTRLMSVVAAVNRLQKSIRGEIPGRSNYGGLMHEFSRLTPETIELGSFGVARQGEYVGGRIGGFAFGNQGQTDLETYIEDLNLSPLLVDVTLGDVQIGRMDGRQGERFSAAFRIVLTPTDHTARIIAGAPVDEEAAP